MTQQQNTIDRRGALRMLAGSAAIFGAAPLTSAFAAEDIAAYPSRPVRFVIPFPPGSGAELIARFIGQKFTELTRQPSVVEPKGGGNGFIAVQSVLGAPRDGYTLFAGSSSTFAHNVALFKKLPYDPLTDFVPLSLFIRSPILLVVPANSPYKTLAEFIAAAKQEPGKLTIGSGSAGYQMMAVLFTERGGIQLLPVPYKSSPDTVKAVLGGEVVVPTLDGSIKLRIPAGAENGQKLRARSRGLPKGKTGERGDFYVVLTVQLPATLTGEERSLWEKLRDVSTFQPRSPH